MQILSGPITAYVEDFITKGADKVLSSEKAYELWLRINEVGHEKIVALLRGETTNVYVQGDDVRLNLLPLISQALVWLDEKLPGGLSSRFNPPVIAPETDPEQGIQEVANWSGRPLPSDFGQITLLQSDALGPAQTAIKWFDRLDVDPAARSPRRSSLSPSGCRGAAGGRRSPSASAPRSPSSSRA